MLETRILPNEIFEESLYDSSPFRKNKIHYLKRNIFRQLLFYTSAVILR